MKTLAAFGKPFLPIKGAWRYRVGDYRLVCAIQEQKLIVPAIESRPPPRHLRLKVRTLTARENPDPEGCHIYTKNASEKYQVSRTGIYQNQATDATRGGR